MLILHIANKNYSSWSLRPWVLMQELEMPFTEQLHVFGDSVDWDEYRSINPSGLVPCLVDGDNTIWDSLAIMEYLAEKYPAVWPTDSTARAWARCASAEMHSGFPALRNICSMNCGLRVKLNEVPLALAHDISRIDALWQEGLERFGGPYLAGDSFTAVDAMYAPVVFRFLTYGTSLSAASADYLERMLNRPSMQLWYSDALQEPYRDESHEIDVASHGTITDDFRGN